MGNFRLTTVAPAGWRTVCLMPSAFLEGLFWHFDRIARLEEVIRAVSGVGHLPLGTVSRLPWPQSLSEKGLVSHRPIISFLPNLGV